MRHRDRGVVGFDIAGRGGGLPALPPPRRRSTSSPSTTSRRPCTRARRTGSTPSGRALFDGRALRLGHGVRLAEDLVVEREDDDRTRTSRVGGSRAGCSDRQIPLELVPTSNLQTGAIAAWGDDPRGPPVRPALPARVPGHRQHRQPADERHHPVAGAGLLTDAFDYDLDDLEIVPAERGRVGVPAARGPGGARRRSSQRFRGFVTPAGVTLKSCPSHRCPHSAITVGAHAADWRAAVELAGEALARSGATEQGYAAADDPGHRRVRRLHRDRAGSGARPRASRPGRATRTASRSSPSPSRSSSATRTTTRCRSCSASRSPRRRRT